MNNSLVYALDFDGVVCDSAIETAISGWKAACALWRDMPVDAPADKVEAFRQVRPIIETGYEAVLAMRMLFLGASIQTLCSRYTREFPTLMEEVNVDSEALKTLFGGVRDAWIAADKTDWIQKNPIYPGVATRLARLGEASDWYIVTTKQERFVAMILEANHINLPEDRIFGLDRNMGKNDVLKLLLERHPGKPIHFVEDRLLTLKKASEAPELDTVHKIFALWGYNGEEDKRVAATHAFQLQQLREFLS